MPETTLDGAWRAPDSGGANPGPRRTDSEREPHIHVRTGYAPVSEGGPASLGFAGFPARRKDRSCMERYTRRIYVRATDADLARAKALAEGTGLSVSDLVRLLLQLLADDVAAERAVVPGLVTGPLASSVRSVAESRILFL